MTIPRRTFFRHLQCKTGLWVPAPLRFAWYPCCSGAAGEDCPQCENNHAPLQFMIDVPAWTDDTCNNCEQYEGAYYLDQGVNPCYYYYQFASICNTDNDYERWSIRLHYEGTPTINILDLSLQFQLGGGGWNSVCHWEKAYPEDDKIPCMELEEEIVTWVYDFRCNTSNTVLISTV